jgi:hypothetical protein
MSWRTSLATLPGMPPVAAVISPGARSDSGKARAASSSQKPMTVLG